MQNSRAFPGELLFLKGRCPYILYDRDPYSVEMLTLQCCGQDTDGLNEAMVKAIARNKVNTSLLQPLVHFAFINKCCI